MSADNLSDYVHLLDFQMFQQYVQSSDGDQMNVITFNIIFLLILTLIQLCCTMFNEIEILRRKIKIAADILFYHIMTVKLEMNREQMKVYTKIHKKLADLISEESDLETEEDWFDQEVYCLLCYVTYNSELDKLIQQSLTAVKHVNNVISTYNKDFEVNWYHKMTQMNKISYFSWEQINMITYMSDNLIKLQWLTDMLHNICIVNKTQIILFHDWSMTLWNITAYVLNLEYEIIDIQSAHSLTEHDVSVKWFNDFNNSIQVLMTSIRTMSTSVNLQQACHHTIFMNVLNLMNTTLQAIGRIFCLRQTKESKIWIATADHIYDQVIQAWTVKKMVSQIAGQGNVTVMKDDITVMKASNNELNDEIIKFIATELKALDLYTRMFEQFDFCLKWRNICNLKTKDMFCTDWTVLSSSQLSIT